MSNIKYPINKIFTRFYSDKIVGKIRHYPPANSEWKDSVYFYNKTSLKESSSNYKLTDKAINYHFNINNLNKIARSRRMRSLIRRSSSKRIFISKPEIKQASNKVTITVYIYDREKQSLIRNLCFYRRSHYLYNLWLNNNNNRKNIKKFSILRKKLQMKRINLFKKGWNKRFPYHNIKYKNEMDFLKFRSLNLYKKFQMINNNAMFLFTSHILSLFNIEIISTHIRTNNIFLKKIIHNKPKLLIYIDSSYNKLYNIKGNDINLNVLKINKLDFKTSQKNMNGEKLNNYLWYLLITNLVNTKFISKEDMIFLYSLFKNKYYNKIINKYYKKKTTIFHDFIKLELNNLKFSNLLGNVKSKIAKIYDKKIELNIINLKYIYLNSDIYTQAITSKLKKKTKVLRVLKKSLALVKRPEEYSYRNEKNNFNNFQHLIFYKSLNLTNINSGLSKKNSVYIDKLNSVFKALFPNNTAHNSNNKSNVNILFYGKESKTINILNTIKYKWIKGVRIEVAGRLTRRNTASRSYYKFRYRGNINDKQYYLELGQMKNMSTVMLRNSARANWQYTSIKSKRRIGAFGVKSWISSY